MNRETDHPDHARLHQSQGLLFPQSARQLCETIDLNWSAAIQLYADGWLSFNPEFAEGLNETQEHELRFVGSLLMGGCDAGLMAILLTGLERPYSYNGRRIYYDWAERRWRLLPTSSPDPDPENVFAGWLKRLKSAGDIVRLEEMKTELDHVLKSLRARQK